MTGDDEYTARRQAEADADFQEQLISEGIAAERATCAKLVRSKGCICDALDLAGWIDGEQPTAKILDDGTVEEHSPACPIAIADEIAGRGKEA